MVAIKDVGEFEAIRRMIAARPAVAGVVVAGGDDAAVLRPEPGMDLAVTTDTFVEGRHWRAEWIGARALGARLALANLSDLAAMAARPQWAVVSYGVRGDHELDEILAFDAGLAAVLADEGAGLVGGNCAAVDGPEWFGLTLFGACAPGRAWTRSLARAGDLIAVTGALGRAGAALALAQRFGAPAAGAWWAPLFEAWAAPESRVGIARALADTGAVHAALDVSDGFGADLHHMCDASVAGVEIDGAAWPIDPLLERAARDLGVPADTLRLGPSDDYELVLAIAPAARASCAAIARDAHVPLAWVGRFTDRAGERIWIEPDGARRVLPHSGWDHFAHG
jgi:thiamine-monophosphate kinase